MSLTRMFLHLKSSIWKNFTLSQAFNTFKYFIFHGHFLSIIHRTENIALQVIYWNVYGARMMDEITFWNNILPNK
jgi:hypothetical protein